MVQAYTLHLMEGQTLIQFTLCNLYMLLSCFLIINFKRFPTLSTKFLAPKDWKFLPFRFMAREDLKAPELIAAAPEWNFWPFMLTCAMFVSGSNTYLVRKRVHQHPAVSL